MVDDGSVVDILYLNAYKRMGLTNDNLHPNSSLLYGFTRDYVIAKGVAKLTITVGDHPRTSTILANFLVVDAMSVINGIMGRLLLKALKVVTSIYHLSMKFLTTKGTREVRGKHYLCIGENNNRSPRASMGKVVPSSLKRSGATEQAHA